MEPTEKESDQIKQEDIAWDAIEGEARNETIPEEDINPHQCDHEPNLLMPYDLKEFPDKKVFIHRCMACGKEIEEIFPVDESDMA